MLPSILGLKEFFCSNFLLYSWKQCRHIPNKNYKKGADNQAKYWPKHGNPNQMTSSDPLELDVVNTTSKVENVIILCKIFLIIHVNYSMNACKCVSMSL